MEYSYNADMTFEIEGRHVEMRVHNDFPANTHLKVTVMRDGEIEDNVFLTVEEFREYYVGSTALDDILRSFYEEFKDTGFEKGKNYDIIVKE